MIMCGASHRVSLHDAGQDLADVNGAIDDVLASVPEPVEANHAQLGSVEELHHDERAQGGQDADLSNLQKGAEFLETLVASRAGLVMRHEADDLGISAKLLDKRVSAAAEAVLRLQRESWKAVLSYVQQMMAVTEPVAYFEYQCYDATPAKLRVENVEGQQNERKIKLWMVETQAAILLANRGRKDTPQQFLLLKMPFSHSPRITARGTALCAQEVLRSCLPKLDSEVAKIFPQPGGCFRIAESDEDKANCRAELQFGAGREGDWSGSLLHSICVGHKTHAACEKTWCLPSMTELITGLINTTKTLEDTEVKNRLFEYMQSELPKRLEVVYGCECAADASIYRENCLLYFMPRQRAARKRAKLTEITRLLNGDWRVPRKLIHHCQGTACCASAASTQAKLQDILVPTLLSLWQGVFSKDNWLEWPRQMLALGWAFFLHQFMLDCILHVLTAGPDAPYGDPEEADEPDGGRAQLQEANRPHDAAGGAPVAAAGVVDPIEAARAEKRRELRIAVGFLQQRTWFRYLYLLRVALEIEISLMAYFMQTITVEADVKEMHDEHVRGARTYRIEALHSMEQLLFQLTRGVDQVCSAQLWECLPETEEWRSEIWRCCCRAMSVLWQLLYTRYTSWPWRMFSLLTQRTEEHARELLTAVPCLKDSWSCRMLARFNSPQQLLSEECRQILTSIGSMLQTTSYSTERLHSINLRRSKTRAHVKRMSVAEVSKKHAACAAPPWLHKRIIKVKPAVQKRKRGRSTAIVPEEGRVPKRHRGGGGPWRAFLHVQVQQSGRPMTRTTLNAWTAAYHALTPAQKSYYTELGRAGPVTEEGGERGVVSLMLFGVKHTHEKYLVC